MRAVNLQIDVVNPQYHLEWNRTRPITERSGKQRHEPTGVVATRVF